MLKFYQIWRPQSYPPFALPLPVSLPPLLSGLAKLSLLLVLRPLIPTSRAPLSSLFGTQTTQTVLAQSSFGPFPKCYIFLPTKVINTHFRDRPGQPPADSWSADHNYVVEFPNGVNYEEPEWLSFVIKHTGGAEEINVALGSNADASQWGCCEKEGTQICTFTGDLIITPYSP